MLGADGRDSSFANFALDPDGHTTNNAELESRPFREYMVNEAVEQYKDYYASDAEES